MNGVTAVTGATGFIGQHLIAMLAGQGIPQRLLVRRLPDLPPAGRFELVPGELADKLALRRLVQGADTVIHLAGAIKARNRKDFFRHNAQAVQDLLDAAEGKTRVILLSSLAAREPQLSDYAASKRAGEDALVAAMPAAGWITIRAPAVYGPGDRETLPFFRGVKLGLAAVPAGRPGRLSLIHVADLSAVLAAALARPPASGVYEIDDGKPDGYSLPEMVQTAAGILGRRTRVVNVARPVVTGVAAFRQAVAGVTGRPAILSPGKVREIFHYDWTVTDRRLAEALGFQPAFDLAGGFADTIAWYRRHHWL